MKISIVRCTSCGANINFQDDRSILRCDFCGSSNVLENALAFSRIEEELAKTVSTIRKNLMIFVQKNSVNEILRTTQNLLDLIPKDFIGKYFFAYAKEQLREPLFMQEFLTSDLMFVDEEFNIIFDHICLQSDFRNKLLIENYLKKHKPHFIKHYNECYQKRIIEDENYSNVPRDVFICFSSFQRSIAENLVHEIEKNGYTCWISLRNLKPNDNENYWTNIEKAIQNSKLVLVISSLESMRSKDVQRELEFVMKYGKKRFEYKVDKEPRTILFKYVFDGIKWVEGIKDLSNLSDVINRIFLELNHSIINQPESVQSGDNEESGNNKVLNLYTGNKSKFSKQIVILSSVFASLIVFFIIYNLTGVRDIGRADNVNEMLTFDSSDFTLRGLAIESHPFGVPYVDPGIDLISNLDGYNVIVSGIVDVQNVGSYRIDYLLSPTNQLLTSRNVNIIDTISPSITLVGGDILIIDPDKTFEEPGYIVSDNTGIEPVVTVIGQYDPNIKGEQIIRYVVSDSSGNIVEVVRKLFLSGTEYSMVAFIDFDGTPIETISGLIETEIPFIVPEKVGFDFVGWMNNAGDLVDLNDSNKFTYQRTLYRAMWEPNFEYFITELFDYSEISVTEVYPYLEALLIDYPLTSNTIGYPDGYNEIGNLFSIISYDPFWDSNFSSISDFNLLSTISSLVPNYPISGRKPLNYLLQVVDTLNVEVHYDFETTRVDGSELRMDYRNTILFSSIYLDTPISEIEYFNLEGRQGNYVRGYHSILDNFPEWFLEESDGYYIFDYISHSVFIIKAYDSDPEYMIGNLRSGYDQTIPAVVYRKK